MTIERSIADVSSKTPKATNPRISSIGEKSSPTSLAVGRVGELDCTGSIVDTCCEMPRSTVGLLGATLLGIIQVSKDDPICGGVGEGRIELSPKQCHLL